MSLLTVFVHVTILGHMPPPGMPPPMMGRGMPPPGMPRGPPMPPPGMRGKL